MSIAVLQGDILATDTMVVVGEAEYETEVRAVIPPSLRQKRMLLEEGGKIMVPEGSDWLFAFTCDEIGAWERFREVLKRSDALQGGDLEPLRSSEAALPEGAALIAVHRQSREVRFFKKRMQNGADASLLKLGLSGEKPFAIGSGSWFALAAIREKRCDARKAAQQACLLDPTSGGRVFWIDLASGEKGYVECPRQPDPERDMPTVPGVH